MGDIDAGTTPVFIAVLADNAPMLALLLEAGGKSGEQESVGGNTDAMTAAFCFHVAALRELHKHNMVHPNLRNHNGESVGDILWAYHRRFAEIARGVLAYMGGPASADCCWQAGGVLLNFFTFFFLSAGNVWKTSSTLIARVCLSNFPPRRKFKIAGSSS